jgi:hypothetical protein
MSVVKLQPAGQQPSPEEQKTMALKEHATLQVAVFPDIWFVVQALLSSHSVGHEPGGSQVSPVSTVPLPQFIGPVPPVAPDVPPEPAAGPPPVGAFEAACLSEHDVAVSPKISTEAANTAFFVIRGPPRAELARSL